jgi:diguanylate cyclase (GGDEF)-like protein
MDRVKAVPQKKINDSLAASLLAQDKNLAHIFSELDDIAKTLESGSQDAQALNDKLHRTVLCAIKQSILDREIRSLALADELTSLYSRRAFFALATQQIRVMRRKGQGLLLFFADVDNLKEINDHHGHGEGDRALIRVAKALKRTFRDSDVLARLGGDEFAVLALEASGQDRDTILTRLEKHIRESSAEESRYPLSLSVGMARFDPKHSVPLGELLAKADEAMYENKRAHSKLRFGAHA